MVDEGVAVRGVWVPGAVAVADSVDVAVAVVAVVVAVLVEVLVGTAVDVVVPLGAGVNVPHASVGTYRAAIEKVVEGTVL
jgi:hypothetical protein